MKIEKWNDLYNEIDTKYKDNKEKIGEDVELLNKEISGMKKYAANLKDEKKKSDMLAQIKKKETRIQNLQGYEKYGAQIDKIKKLKSNINGRLKNIESEKEKGIQKVKTLEEQLKDENKNMLDLKNKNKEENTVKLTNQEYDELQEKIKASKEKIEKIKKEIDEQKNKNKSYEEKIKELQGKAGKCNLAWTTLFSNKDWDEIQRRQLKNNERFTKKDSDKNKENEENKDNKEKTEIKSEENATSLVEVKKTSWLKKFTNFIKNTANNVKNFFIEPEDEELADKKNVKETVEKIKENIAEGDKPKTQKDKFLEGLRSNVDLQYKEDIKSKKEQLYIEQHKTKTKKEVTYDIADDKEDR